MILASLIDFVDFEPTNLRVGTSSGSARAGFAAASLALAACSEVPGPAQPRGGAPPARGLPMEGVHHWEDVAPPGHPTRFTVERVDGVTREEVQSLLDSGAGELDECVGPHAGKLTVKFERRSGKLALDLVRSASLDPMEERCVLDALGRLTTSAQPTPGEPRADGFTSLISIEW